MNAKYAREMQTRFIAHKRITPVSAPGATCPGQQRCGGRKGAGPGDASACCAQSCPASGMSPHCPRREQQPSHSGTLQFLKC